MSTEFTTGKPTDDTGKLLVRLTRTGKRYVVVTEDGTRRTRALGLVSERNIFLQYGRFPTLLGEAMAEAKSTSELRALRDRSEALILEFLEDRELVPWLMEITGVLNRALEARVLALAESAMAADGWEKPVVDYAWLMMGSGGRDELLIRSAVYHALIYDDPIEADAHSAKLYFRELGRRTTNAIRECGFLDSEQGILASEEHWCLPKAEMFAKFERMITDPVNTHVYTFRDAFDFRPVEYQNPLALALRTHVNTVLAAHPEFLRHMAKDSLLNQPPRTIFQEYVIDEEGARKEELEIKHHALLPLVDAARVLALATSEITTTSTFKRFYNSAVKIADLDADEQSLVREAGEAFLILAFARTQQGLRNGTNGAVIRPADLEPELRPLIKTAFRTILSTLEMIAQRYNLELRV
jgi:CBS domain-containing protein